MPGGSPDTAMQEASEPAAVPEPPHASSAGADAAKEREKAAAPDANGAVPVSLTDAIPAGKLRMAAATALSAAAVRAIILTMASHTIVYTALSSVGSLTSRQGSMKGYVAGGACLSGTDSLFCDTHRISSRLHRVWASS